MQLKPLEKILVDFKNSVVSTVTSMTEVRVQSIGLHLQSLVYKSSTGFFFLTLQRHKGDSVEINLQVLR